MERAVVYQARNLPPDQRHAIEAMLGGPLADNEVISVEVRGRIIKEAATGEEREEAFRAILAFSDRMAKHAEGIPEEEIDALIDEACDYVRHHPE